MIVFCLFILFLFLSSIFCVENGTKKQEGASKEKIYNDDCLSKTGKLIIYKNSSVATVPLRFEKGKPLSIKVAGSIDPKSILFHGSHEENLEYIIKNQPGEKANMLAADLLLNASRLSDSQITYYFSGIAWSTHYVVEINEQFSEVKNFNGFIDIDNQSGADFHNFNLRLVDAKIDSLAKNQEFNEYVVTRAKNIYKDAVVRIPWVNAKNQAAEQDYRLDVGGENLGDLQGNLQSPQKNIPLQIWIGFKLAKKLAKDLPEGDVEIYITDSDGTIRPLGKSTIYTTKTDDDIQIGMPSHLLMQLKKKEDSPLSQIQARLEQTEYKTMTTAKVTEASYRLIIRNSSDKEITIKVMLSFDGNLGKVIRESLPHQQENDTKIYWPVKVSQNAEVMLRYRIQLRKE